MSFLVTLDTIGYGAKPTSEVGAITRRLQGAGATECDSASLCAAIARGQTWVGATFEPCATGWGEFQQQQLFALDFDNDAPALGSDGQPIKGKKRPLCEGEPGYLGPFDARDRCASLGLAPLCLYFTFNSSTDWPRFRLVFDLGERLGEADAQEALRQLLMLFPEADQACKNPNRLFYGSRFPVVEYWRSWGGAS